MSTFKKATKTQARARIAFVGPSGSGKTYSSLAVAAGLGSKVAVIDTEHGSASKYAGIFDFDVLTPENFSPPAYVEAIEAAAKEGYDVLVIDSLSHAWMGKGGALEMVDNAAKRSRSGNSYTAWRDVTPLHNALIEAILAAPLHVIATMRAKTEYILEEGKDGKKTPKKIGMAPIQRDGMEYEFDVVGDLTHDLDFIVSKTRCPALSEKIINKPGAQLAETLMAWLSDGEALPLPPPPVDPLKEKVDAFLAACAEKGYDSVEIAEIVLDATSQRTGLTGELAEGDMPALRAAFKNHEATK